jgi:hypothetical protein
LINNKKTRLGGCRKKRSVPVLDVPVETTPILDAVLDDEVQYVLALDVVVQDKLFCMQSGCCSEAEPILNVVVQIKPKLIVEVQTKEVLDIVVQTKLNHLLRCNLIKFWMLWCKLKHLCVLRRCTSRSKL